MRKSKNPLRVEGSNLVNINLFFNGKKQILLQNTARFDRPDDAVFWRTSSRKTLIAMTACFLYAGSILYGNSEVIPETKTRVIVREHPRTGKPFVVIASNLETQDPFMNQKKLMKRPDYRMLDPKVKSGKIPYDGPSSDRKKVYILAASLATIGTVSGAAVLATAPAATGAVASGGAGVYSGVGAGIAAGTISGSLAASKSDPDKTNFTHVFESHAVDPEASKK